METGEPPYLTDIYRSLITLNQAESKFINFRMMCFTAFDLVRNDELLTDDMMNRYTINRKY